MAVRRRVPAHPQTELRDQVEFEGYYVRGQRQFRLASLADSAPSSQRANVIDLGGEAAIVRPGATERSIDPGEAWTRARSLSLPGIHIDTAVAKDVHAEPLFSVTARNPRFVTGLDSEGPIENDDPSWAIAAVRAREAWALSPPLGGGQRGSGIVIAHPDTGYTWHPALRTDRLCDELGRDFHDDRQDPKDTLRGLAGGHGTSTASVIMTEASRGIHGVAPGANLVPIRVSNSVVHFSFSNLIEGLYHARDVAKAQVVSMSLGGPFPSRALEEAVDSMTARGLVLLAAAGNVWPWVVYPARYEAVLAVAATDSRDKPWSFSASGPDVDLSAPGAGVWRARTRWTRGREQYDEQPSSGTSYAVAHVAGACAVWLAFHASALEKVPLGDRSRLFRQCAMASARSPAGWDPTSGHGSGILDVEGLLQQPPRMGPAAAVGKAEVPSTDRYFSAQVQAKGVVGEQLAKVLRGQDTSVRHELEMWLAVDPVLRRRLAAHPKGNRKTQRVVELRGASEHLLGRLHSLVE